MREYQKFILNPIVSQKDILQQLQEKISKQKMKTKIVRQIYEDIVLEVPENELKEIQRIIASIVPTKMSDLSKIINVKRNYTRSITTIIRNSIKEVLFCLDKCSVKKKESGCQ
jgi:hypothetical protein